VSAAQDICRICIFVDQMFLLGRCPPPYTIFMLDITTTIEVYIEVQERHFRIFLPLSSAAHTMPSSSSRSLFHGESSRSKFLSSYATSKLGTVSIMISHPQGPRVQLDRSPARARKPAGPMLCLWLVTAVVSPCLEAPAIPCCCHCSRSMIEIAGILS
jgi:hypothetical protein